MAAKEILEAFKKSSEFKRDEVYDRFTIENFMKTIKNGGLQNPTALTYNQWNCGMTFICPLFEKIDRGKYKYIGSGAEFTGDCYHVRKTGTVEEKIGVWNQGEFNFFDENIVSFSDWKSIKCPNGELSLTKPQKDLIDAPKHSFTFNHDIMKYGFETIGEYYMDKNEPKCRYNVSKNEKKSIVYALIVDNNIKYIGKTIRGYSRPLSYLKNDVMINVKEGILSSLKENKSVNVLVKSENLEHTIDGLSIDLCEGYEQALISKFKPDWNNHIRQNIA